MEKLKENVKEGHADVAGTLDECAAWIGSMPSRLAFRPLVYGYANARVRTMRTELLTRRQAEDLLAVRNNAGVVEYLSKTVYREEFANLPIKMNDEERLEIAIGRNFAKTAQKLFHRIVPEQSKPIFKAFLGRYDVHNLKTVLLARKLGKGREEARNLLIPAGSLTAEHLEKMLTAENADELYRIIEGTEFGGKFLTSASIRHIPKEHVKAALKNPNSEEAKLDLLLSSLDSYYYEVTSSAVKMTAEKDADVVLSLLKGEADAKNAVTVMRLKRAGKADRETIMRHIIRGGGFSQKQLEKMAGAKDVPEAARIASSFFKSDVGRKAFIEAEERYKRDGLLSHFETVFEHSMARHSLWTLRRSMMSIGTIAGFLFLKEEEMNNIRKIARGKALGLPAKRIAEMLVLVG